MVNVGVDLSKVVDRLQEHKTAAAMEGDRKIYGLLQMMGHSRCRLSG